MALLAGETRAAANGNIPLVFVIILTSCYLRQLNTFRNQARESWACFKLNTFSSFIVDLFSILICL